MMFDFAEISPFLYALSAFVTSFFLTRVMIRRVRIMDIPNHRSSHKTPTPRSGGIALLLSSLVFSSLYLALSTTITQPLVLVSVSLLFLSAVSLLDDLYDLGMLKKLAAQVLSASLFLLSGFHISLLYVPFLGPVDLGMFGYFLSFLWIIALTNAFNFMDGLDTLAGGQAILVGLGALALASFLAHPLLPTLIGIFVAASAGFLIHNLPPAKIFMGDTGSQVLGYGLACLALFFGHGDPTGVAAYCLPIMLFSFIWDTGFTLIRRKLAGDPITAHRTHLYQLLNRSGWSHKAVAALHHVAACAQVGLALAVYQGALSIEQTLGLLFSIYGLYSLWVVKKAKKNNIL